MVTKLNRTCVHEAGHAFATWYTGGATLRLSYNENGGLVSIFNNKQGDNVVGLSEDWPGNEYNIPRIWQIKIRGLILYAGPFAEYYYCEKGWRNEFLEGKYAYRDKYRKAYDYIMNLSTTDTDKLDELDYEACNIFKKSIYAYWAETVWKMFDNRRVKRGVLSLAAELEKSGVIYESEVINYYIKEGMGRKYNNPPLRMIPSKELKKFLHPQHLEYIMYMRRLIRLK